MPTLYEQASTAQYARTDLLPGQIGVFRWYLRLDQPEEVAQLKRPRDDLSVERLDPVTLQAYRALYDAIGADWMWADRRRMDQNALAAEIKAAGVSVHVLKAAGDPAGAYELDTRPTETTNISYFGLMPGYLGQGLGPWLLREAIAHAVQLGATAVTLNTCTLDHPKALRNYMAAGFKIIATEQEDYDDPRLDGTLPRDSAPHVPLAKID